MVCGVCCDAFTRITELYAYGPICSPVFGSGYPYTSQKMKYEVDTVVIPIITLDVSDEDEYEKFCDIADCELRTKDDVAAVSKADVSSAKRIKVLEDQSLDIKKRLTRTESDFIAT